MRLPHLDPPVAATVLSLVDFCQSLTPDAGAALFMLRGLAIARAAEPVDARREPAELNSAPLGRVLLERRPR